MAGINSTKVMQGGLVAAVVMTAIDFVAFGVVLQDGFAANLTRLGLDPAVLEAPAGFAAWLVTELVFGFLLVWTYAAMRPRFGQGPQTALMAAAVPFVSVNVVLASFVQNGILDSGLFVSGLVASVLSIGAGAVAGAWVYKEG